MFENTCADLIKSEFLSWKVSRVAPYQHVNTSVYIGGFAYVHLLCSTSCILQVAACVYHQRTNASKNGYFLAFFASELCISHTSLNKNE
jgi:hypothetical protein